MADPGEVKFKAGIFEMKPSEAETYTYPSAADVPRLDVLSGVAVPLHAQVAAALGWTTLQDRGDGVWVGVQPETGLTVEVPPYGRSWCSTGGLVDRFFIGLKLFGGRAWLAFTERDKQTFSEFGDTPCEAIARVVVEIHRKKDK